MPYDCPHCGSSSNQKYGRDKYGVQRYKCKSCKKTFNELSGITPATYNRTQREFRQNHLDLLRLEANLKKLDERIATMEKKFQS